MILIKINVEYIRSFIMCIFQTCIKILILKQTKQFEWISILFSQTLYRAYFTFLGYKCDWWSDERRWWISNWKQGPGTRAKNKEIVHSSDNSTLCLFIYLFMIIYLLILITGY